MVMYDLLNALAMLEKPDGVIAFPTDTVYGIGCLPDRVEAVEKIYRLKSRDAQKPLILLGKDSDSLTAFVETVPDIAKTLMTEHWPGPLTIVLAKNEKVPNAITKGFETVGLRQPKCELLTELLSLVPGGVLATTSANVSGEPPCLTAKQVSDTLGNDLDFVLADDLAITDRLASTVIAIESDGTLRVLRTGSIKFDDP
ncbi:MAG: threonylcarbamoyl-AMP synthase [Vampirovibrio sp.]|nr:threonylcarbamoyl-AMP synthase [Vampirovibrio sp.]